MTARIKFIHCADLHLDSPFQGLTTKEPSLADRFKHATNDTFVKIMDLCLAEKVDFLTIGGDTFDGADRSLCAQILLRDQFERLHKANIHVIIVAGNHDPLSDWLTEIKYPENVHLIGSDKVEKVPIEKNGKTVATIHGISHKEREVTENLSLKFHAKENGPVSIGLLHANVGSRKEHAPYAPCTINDLKAANIDIWLLGHIHTPEVLCDDPLILYPGNIQGRHINEDGPRGCYIIKTDSNRKISYEFKAVQNILWKQEEINIKNIMTAIELADLLSDKCEEELSKLINDEKGIVIRWNLTGSSPLYHELTMTDKIEETKEILVEHFFNQTPFIFPESIRLSIKPERKKEDYLNQENFIGDFLKLAGKAKNDDHMKSELLEMLNQPLSNRTIRKYIEEVSEKELLTILEDSVNLGIDLLSGDK
ncbi:MAG: DNA repair exonuclease [Candidatus Scalindua sp.]|nr:DNA repair exonuclease [Candidatus Scalindua sp.]MBT5303909.1 DNA repair exonuclease [Candidatus Scalindua sp.]MBT6047802.1 DNA repair exonuclease [Candidatus Scalindua sp.]MBT6225599.1 DNA repair exonuclease [Candidatus Scalindua sp.]MBT6560952.1 DNA repair exonuclease [Candidatus Scalindua sp.]